VRILVVEDKVKLAVALQRGLRKAGLAADVTASGEEAVWMVESTPYDAVVLDVMLPGIDGFETCRRLRSGEVWAPILMLTARDRVDDRVAGLDAGADDYLTKPFAFRELLARLRALARRGAASARQCLRSRSTPGSGCPPRMARRDRGGSSRSWRPSCDMRAR
jgi:two-component system OmpR family response regulator